MIEEKMNVECVNEYTIIIINRPEQMNEYIRKWMNDTIQLSDNYEITTLFKTVTALFGFVKCTTKTKIGLKTFYTISQK